MLCAILAVFDHQRVHINQIPNRYVIFARLGGWGYGGLKKQGCRNRMIQAQGISQLSRPLLYVFFDVSRRIRSVISQAIAQFNAMAFHFYLYFAELPVPLFVVRIISQHVVGRTVADSIANRSVKIIAVVVGLAAGAVCQQVHSAVGRKKTGRFSRQRASKLRTPKYAAPKAVGAAARGREGGKTLESAGVNRIDRYLRVSQQLRGLGKIVGITPGA